MSDLDDGLTSAPTFLPATIKADWLDLPAGYDANVTVDSVKDLSSQIGPGGFEVNQSIDDGLPDPVTMTGSNDASGSLLSDLVGRPGVEALESSIGWNALTTSGNGTGTVIPVPLPADVAFMDYVLVAITVVSSATVTETTVAAGLSGSWTMLGEVTDQVATPYRTWLFGRQHFTGALAPSFSIASSADWNYVCASIKAARTPGGAWIRIRPDWATTTAEGAGSVTAHTTGPATLTGRGWTVGVFGTGSGAGPWVPAGDAISVVASAGGSSALLLARSPLRRTERDYTMTANTTLATAVAGMIHLPLVIEERPTTDATAYFSPYSPDSPVVGMERDTAPTTAAVNVLTPVGPVSTPIFRGVMQDITLNGDRTADLQAVSATRLKMDDSYVVPTVSGYREGATTDWLTTFVMAKGGQYPGIAPGPLTRWWAPLHGSLHPHMDGPTSFPLSEYYTTARTPGQAYRNSGNIETVPGPFVTGIFGQMKNDMVIRNIINLDSNWDTGDPPGVDNPTYYAPHTAGSNQGRFTMWIRGDAADAAPAALAGQQDYLFNMQIRWDTPFGYQNRAMIQLNNDRTWTIDLGNSVTQSSPISMLPTDGNWHFVGFAWDWTAGLTRTRVDNVTFFTNSHVSTTSPLPKSFTEYYRQGNLLAGLVDARLPVSELQMEFGPGSYTTSSSTTFVRFWPTQQSPSRNATYRSTDQQLAAIALPDPIQGWSMLQSLAESTLSHLRINEEDNIEFLPLRYFGEAAQMAVSNANVLDTDVNSSELKIETDASKSRNIVTSEYQEVRVDTNRTTVLEYSTPVTIRKGETFVTFALDTLIVETHGAAFWGYDAPQITKLTASHVAGSTPLPNDHLMSVNLLPDGSGTYVASSVIDARIVSWSNSTVTVRFRNNWKTMYLVNNGSQIPFLRILGYPVRSVDAYTTMRDAGSVGLRRPRALTTGLEWVQTRAVAELVTGQLVALLSRPRYRVDVTVMGDPRRRPGQLTTLTDSSGTRVKGTWRILSVKHRGNGAMYVQDLSLVRVGEIGIWDESLWDDAVWGE